MNAFRILFLLVVLAGAVAAAGAHLAPGVVDEMNRANLVDRAIVESMLIAQTEATERAERRAGAARVASDPALVAELTAAGPNVSAMFRQASAPVWGDAELSIEAIILASADGRVVEEVSLVETVDALTFLQRARAPQALESGDAVSTYFSVLGKLYASETVPVSGRDGRPLGAVTVIQEYDAAEVASRRNGTGTSVAYFFGFDVMASNAGTPDVDEVMAGVVRRTTESTIGDPGRLVLQEARRVGDSTVVVAPVRLASPGGDRATEGPEIGYVVAVRGTDVPNNLLAVLAKFRAFDNGAGVVWVALAAGLCFFFAALALLDRAIAATINRVAGAIRDNATANDPAAITAATLPRWVRPVAEAYNGFLETYRSQTPTARRARAESSTALFQVDNSRPGIRLGDREEASSASASGASSAVFRDAPGAELSGESPGVFALDTGAPASSAPQSDPFADFAAKEAAASGASPAVPPAEAPTAEAVVPFAQLPPVDDAPASDSGMAPLPNDDTVVAHSDTIAFQAFQSADASTVEAEVGGGETAEVPFEAMPSEDEAEALELLDDDLEEEGADALEAALPASSGAQSSVVSVTDEHPAERGSLEALFAAAEAEVSGSEDAVGEERLTTSARHAIVAEDDDEEWAAIMSDVHETISGSHAAAAIEEAASAAPGVPSSSSTMMMPGLSALRPGGAIGAPDAWEEAPSVDVSRSRSESAANTAAQDSIADVPAQPISAATPDVARDEVAEQAAPAAPAAPAEPETPAAPETPAEQAPEAEPEPAKPAAGPGPGASRQTVMGMRVDALPSSPFQRLRAASTPNDVEAVRDPVLAAGIDPDEVEDEPAPPPIPTAALTEAEGSIGEPIEQQDPTTNPTVPRVSVDQIAGRPVATPRAASTDHDALLAAAEARLRRLRPQSASAPVTEEHRPLYDEFVSAKELCGEPTDGMSYDKFVAKLDRNRATLMSRYDCERVKFGVAIRDGKVSLKATPVKRRS